MKSLTVEKLISDIGDLKAGDQLLLSGTVYTARDAAHKRIAEMISQGRDLPIDLKNKVIYYCGPCPAKPGYAIGSCGPTTSSRMDPLTPLLLANGVKATIGKGPRALPVIEAMKINKAVYLAATGGAGALYASKVRKASLIAFGDLGPEAVYAFELLDFPVIVANDVYGNDIFKRAS